MVALLLRARGTTPAGLGPIRDLVATFTYPDDVELAGSSMDNAVAEQLQLWIEGESNRGPWVDEIDPITFASVQEGNVLNIRVRGVNAAGEVGPASNASRFNAFNSGCTLRDARMATFLGLTAANTGVSLSGASLTHVAGDLVVVIAHLHSTGAAIVPTQMTLPTGWVEVTNTFAAKTNEQAASRAAWWISDGTDQTIPMVDCAASAINIRINYSIYSFSYLGEMRELTNPAAEATDGNPAAATLAVGSEGSDTVLCFASQGGTSSTPGMQGAPWTHPPSHNQAQDQTTTIVCRSRTLVKIFSPAETKADFTVDAGDNGVNSFCEFGWVFSEAA